MISVNGINKSYGSSKVLNDISFQIEDNDYAVIIGASGSGK